jgi:hypothetical protein
MKEVTLKNVAQTSSNQMKHFKSKMEAFLKKKSYLRLKPHNLLESFQQTDF